MCLWFNQNKHYGQYSISCAKPFSQSVGFSVRSIRADQQTGQLCDHMQVAQARWPKSIPVAAPAEIYLSSYREIHHHQVSHFLNIVYY